MKRLLYIECFSGVAGDMLLAALVAAGLPEARLREALGELGVGHDLRVSRVVRAGVSAVKVDVVPQPGRSRRQKSVRHAHGDGASHTHAVDGQQHRSLAEIVGLIGRTRLSPAVRAKAVGLVTRLAEVEASIHNVPVDQVHLHEVGAVDSIIDIVGCTFGLAWFGVDAIVASPLNVGSGSVKIAHGVFPVPAPATLRLVAGVPVYAEGPKVELTTPTGALLVAGHASRFGAMPAMVVEASGYGAGARDFVDRPNVVRVVIGRESDPRGVPAELPGDVVKIECEIDDMNPQLFGPVMEDLLEIGALDVFLTPVQMKKQRPGTLLTVIAAPEAREMLTAVIFDHTTTLGLRYAYMRRETLERRSILVQTPLGEIRIKVAGRDGHVLNAAPEFEDCVRAARANGVPVKLVQAQAMRAWLGGEGRRPETSARRTERRPSPNRASRADRVGRPGRSGPRGKR